MPSCTAEIDRTPGVPVGPIVTVFPAVPVAFVAADVLVPAGVVARPGFLVALREVALHVERIDHLAGKLQVHVECLLAPEVDANIPHIAVVAIHCQRDNARV